MRYHTDTCHHGMGQDSLPVGVRPAGAPSRWRGIVWVLLGLWVLVGTRAGYAADTAPAGMTREQAQQVLDVLNDPAKRAAFQNTLSAIASGLPRRNLRRNLRPYLYPRRRRPPYPPNLTR